MKNILPFGKEGLIKKPTQKEIRDVDNSRTDNTPEYIGLFDHNGDPIVRERDGAVVSLMQGTGYDGSGLTTLEKSLIYDSPDKVNVKNGNLCKGLERAAGIFVGLGALFGLTGDADAYTNNFKLPMNHVPLELLAMNPELNQGDTLMHESDLCTSPADTMQLDLADIDREYLDPTPLVEVGSYEVVEKIPIDPSYTIGGQITVKKLDLRPAGFEISEGAFGMNDNKTEGSIVSTLILSTQIKGFILKGVLEAYTHIEDEDTHEFDLVIEGSKEVLNKEEGPLKGSFTALAGYQVWAYPTHLLGNGEGITEHVLRLGVNYVRPINLNIGDFKAENLDITAHISKLVHDGFNPHRNQIYMLFDAPFVNKKGDIEYMINPKLRLTHTDDWYGVSGLSNITYGLEAGIKKGNFGVVLGVDFQNGRKGLGSHTNPYLTISYKIPVFLGK